MSDPVLEFAFDAGIDEASYDELVTAGQAFVELLNGRRRRRGGFSKRLGFTALGSSVIAEWGTARGTSTRATGDRIGSANGKPYVIGDGVLSIYDEDAAAWFSLGRVPEVGVETHAAASAWSGNTLSNAVDMVVCNGIRAVATITYDPGTGNYDVRVGLETVDGLMLRPHETIGFSSSTAYPSVQLGCAGTTIYAVVGAFGSAVLNGRYTTAASISAAASTGWSSAGVLAADRTTTGNASYQLATQSLTDRVAFAYVNNSGGASQVTVKTFNTTGVLETATVNTSSAKPDMVGLEGSISDTLWVAWNETTSVKVKGLTGNSLATVKATTGSMLTFDSGSVPGPLIIRTGIGIVSDPSTPGSAWLVCQDLSNKNTHLRTFATSGGAAVIGSSERKVYGVLPLARPFTIGGRFYCAFAPYGGTGHCIVGDVSNTVFSSGAGIIRPIASVFPAISQQVAQHFNVGTSTVEFCVSAKRSASAATPEVVTLDFVSADRWHTATTDGVTFIGGGVLSYVDDASVPEAACLHGPGAVAVTGTGTAGSLTGNYSYVATFEQVDSNGNWTISSVSPAVASGSVTSKKIDLEIPPLSLSNRLRASRDESVRVVLYRTADGNAAPYYYLTDLIDDTSSMITYTDNTIDAVLTSGRQLMGTGNLPGTGGAAQDRRAPPFVNCITEYNGMLVVSSMADIYWSGQPVSGEGRWWSPAFLAPLPKTKVTALEAMDGVLYAFVEDTAYTMAGEAPSDNGKDGGLSTPRHLAIDVGSIDGHTLVTELGIWFRSKRGIELLGRGGGVTWVGEQIQNTLDTYPIVTSMVLDDRNSIVRISLAASLDANGRATGGGRTLVYDLTGKSWDAIDDVRGSSAHEAAQDAAMITVADERRYAWLGSDGVAHLERLDDDASAYLDGSTWVAMRAVTPWARLAAVNGEQFVDQVLLLAKRETDHDLTISLAFDYSSSYTTTKTFTAAQIGALARQWLVKEVTQTTHQAVRAKLEDATPTIGTVGNGKGATWLALAFNGKPHQGPKRTSAAMRGGS